jgi:chromosome segregation ATPase
MSTPHADVKENSPADPDLPDRVAERRIHAPHLRDDGSRLEPSDPAAESAAADSTAAPEPEIDRQLARQLSTQAAQLVRELDLRQKDLDHRESQLHAQMAQLEQSVRAARLWASEKEAQITTRLAELRPQEHDARARLDRLAAAEAAFRRMSAAKEKELAAREEAARRHEAELQDRDRRLVDQLAAERAQRRDFELQQEKARDDLTYQQQRINTGREASLELVRQLLAGVEQRRQAVEARAEQIEQRVKQAAPPAAVSQPNEELLSARWSKLEKAEAELQTRRRQLAVEQQQFRETIHAERHQATLEQRRTIAELDQQRQAVERRSQHVDKCHAALEQLRGEISRMHREALEIRLATEELWAQLSGVAAPATLTQSLGKIRARLAEDYRLANQELQQQREELTVIRRELAEQHAALVREKRQLDRVSGER